MQSTGGTLKADIRATFKATLPDEHVLIPTRFPRRLIHLGVGGSPARSEEARPGRGRPSFHVVAAVFGSNSYFSQGSHNWTVPHHDSCSQRERSLQADIRATFKVDIIHGGPWASLIIGLICVLLLPTVGL